MDDLEILKASIQQVLAQDCDARSLHRYVDEQGSDLAGNLRLQAGELGWLGIGPTDDAGGLGLGLPGAAMLARELGKRLAPGPFVPVLVCLQVIERFAPREISERLLGGLMSGERSAAIPASFDAGESGGLLLGDIEQGGSVVLLPGEKDLVLATARGAGEPVQQREAWDRTRALWDTPADPEVLCVLPDGAAHYIEMCASLLIAADTLGAMEGLFDLTVDFLKQREQFGRAIGSFQALKHRMADLAVQIELADCLLEQALEAAHTDNEGGLFWSGMCKAEVSDAAAFLAGECLQLHGAIGFTWEHNCHLYLKRIRLNQALVRSNDALRQAGFGALEAASSDGRSLMEIGQ